MPSQGGQGAGGMGGLLAQKLQKMVQINRCGKQTVGCEGLSVSALRWPTLQAVICPL